MFNQKEQYFKDIDSVIDRALYIIYARKSFLENLIQLLVYTNVGDEPNPKIEGKITKLESTIKLYDSYTSDFRSLKMLPEFTPKKQAKELTRKVNGLNKKIVKKHKTEIGFFAVLKNYVETALSVIFKVKSSGKKLSKELQKTEDTFKLSTLIKRFSNNFI